MAVPRLHVDAPLAAGAEIALDEARARYLTTVLRLQLGAQARLFNGADGEWSADLVAAGKRGARLRVAALLRPQRAAPDLWLLFAPVKRHATDLIVEKAVELGVGALRPVITRRTVTETARLDRWRAIAVEAAEQTERLDLPEIVAPTTLEAALAAWDDARPLFYADERGEADGAPWGGREGRAAPLHRVAAETKTAQAALLIGPEGGFDPQERALLRSFAFVRPVSLGPRILRAETAVIAALAVLQAHWGDWAL